jgi:hypothetical protein
MVARSFSAYCTPVADVAAVELDAAVSEQVVEDFAFSLP